MQRVVAITGGFGTLGRAVGSAFEADGWKVALLDRAPAPDAASPAERATQWWSGGVDLADLAAARQRAHDGEAPGIVVGEVLEHQSGRGMEAVAGATLT